jgi:hypothetical protein
VPHAAPQSLNLARNTLASLPTEIGGLKGLTQLDVSRNNLKTVPAQLCQLTGLKVRASTRLAQFAVAAVVDLRRPPQDDRPCLMVNHPETTPCNSACCRRSI